MFLGLLCHTFSATARVIRLPSRSTLIPAENLSGEITSELHPSSLSKRAPVSHYRQLGVWRMVERGASALFSAALTVSKPSRELSELLSSVMLDASQAMALDKAEQDTLIWGRGAIEFVLRIVDGEGSPAKVPWELVLQMAQDIKTRTENGAPMMFKATVSGPLAANVLGGLPYIEVILNAAAETIFDGFGKPLWEIT